MLQYSVNFGNMGAAFAVPAAVVDEHLRLCSALQLKLILLLLRTGSALSDEELARQLRQNPADIRDAAAYWESCGLLAAREENAEHSAAASRPAAPALPVSQEVSPAVREIAAGEDRRTVIVTDSRRFTRAECNELASRDRRLMDLLQKAQDITGSTLTSVDMQCLTALYAYYGLSPEYIITVMGYCKSIGKLSMRYVEKTAASWLENGVDTLPKAERYIEYLGQRRSHEGLVRSAFGIGDRGLTTREREFIQSWFGQLGYGIDVIRLAYERAVENTGKLSFAYINKVLQNWHAEGIKTAADAANASARKNYAGRSAENTSYSIHDLEDRVFDDFIHR